MSTISVVMSTEILDKTTEIVDITTEIVDITTEIVDAMTKGDIPIYNYLSPTKSEDSKKAHISFLRGTFERTSETNLFATKQSRVTDSNDF